MYLMVVMFLLLRGLVLEEIEVFYWREFDNNLMMKFFYFLYELEISCFIMNSYCYILNFLENIYGFMKIIGNFKLFIIDLFLFRRDVGDRD